MPRRGLNREKITMAAMQLIEKKGLRSFSMNELAKQLKIKPASLYAHFTSIDDLYTVICFMEMDRLADVQNQAIRGKFRNDALYALAHAYRDYALEHYELYSLVMSAADGSNPEISKKMFDAVSPIMTVMSQYNISNEAQVFYQRMLRSIMHGFICQESSGLFAHYSQDIDDSFDFAIQTIADGIYRETH